MSVHNKTGTEHCAFCDNTGWVALKGTIRYSKHAPTYERGSAPCRWCEWGATVRIGDPKSLKPTRLYNLEDDYQPDDVDVPTPRLERKNTMEMAAAKREYSKFLASYDDLATRMARRRWDLVPPKPRVPQLDGSLYKRDASDVSAVPAITGDA